jgi:multiple sugar transport system permease protein/raffinose/stachyose/melibiose transport system permease protein
MGRPLALDRAEQSLSLSRLKLPRASAMLSHGALWLLLLLTLAPFALMIVRSFKSFAQAMQTDLRPSLPIHYGGYLRAWDAIHQYAFNSLLVTALSLVGALLFASLSSYVFGRCKFPGRSLLFYSLISLMMLPGILGLIPRLILIVRMGMINSLWGLILVYWASQVFMIFVLRTFVESLPEELFEAARIDGAGHLQLYWHITVPLSAPVLSVLAILNVLQNWNDYIWPLLVIRENDLRTIPLGLVYLKSAPVPDPGAEMASYVLASLPLLLLFVFTMRSFVQGLTTGALKV